jgi:GT2 family glycosyltransferase
MPVDLAAIVVGMNSLKYVRECLGSFASVDWRGYSYEVIYVDNGSTDGTQDVVRREFPWVRVLTNEQNVGFCKACNQGAAASDSRYVYLLNVDTVLLPQSVYPLAAFLDRVPEAGAAANRLLNPDLSDQWSARRFPTWSNALLGRRTWLGRLFPRSKVISDYLYKDWFASPDPFPVDWVPGSCTLVRRDAFEQVGGLPNNMHYWSDAVFCHRLEKANWKVYVLPSAPLIHHEGKGTGGKSSALRRWLISDFHNGAYILYCERHDLGAWSLARMIARFGLGLRAHVLIAADWLTSRP